MNYISFAFVIFLLGLLIFYGITPNRYKWIVLLAFSLIFYASYGIDKLLFVLGTSMIIYMASRRMKNIWSQFEAASSGVSGSSVDKKTLQKEYAKKSKRVLIAAMIICFGLMFCCKFGLKTLNIFNEITGGSIAMNIILPLGISYYTFSAVGYLIDVHWRAVEAEENYPKLLLCMIYFPHIVQGPIEKYEKLFPQFDNLTFPDYDRFCKGLQLVLWGLFKKLVIADRLGIFVNGVFSNVNNNWGYTFLIALIFAAFQMYTDFSGCMDIITGVSDIIGIKLEENFNHPFLARTVTDFWHRWHMSLFYWLRDYVYMPMLTSSAMTKLRKTAKKKIGGEAAKTIVRVMPTFCVFLLVGIWHDINLQKIFYGVYWTVLFIASSAFENKLVKLSAKLHLDTESAGWHIFQKIRTFMLFSFSFLSTSPKNWKDAVITFTHMVSRLNPWIFWDGSLYSFGLDRANFNLAILLIIFLMIIEVFQERCNIRNKIAKCNIAVRWTIYYIGIFAVLIFGVYGPGYDAASFIYQQF